MPIPFLKLRAKLHKRIAEQRRKDWDKRLDLIHTVSIFDTPAARKAKQALQELRGKDWAS